MGTVTHLADEWIYPIFREPGWQRKGQCNGLDPNIFVPKKKGSKDTTHYDKTYCNACIVREECLDFALANRAKKGLWGGTTPKQREKMYKLYQGKREYELDMDRLVGIKRDDDDDLAFPDDTSEATISPLRMPLAPDAPIYFSWVEETYVQCTLFPEYPWVDKRRRKAS